MTWGQLAESVQPARRIVAAPPYRGGYEAGGRLAQITDDMIAEQGTGPVGFSTPAVFAVVRLIASTIDQLDITVADGPAPEWLDRPRRVGSQFDQGDLIQWVVASMALSGKAYLRVTKRIGEGWTMAPIHANSVQVITSSAGVVERTYLLAGEEIQPVPAYMTSEIPGEGWTVGKSYILHIPYLITPDFPEGASPLTACRLSLAGYATVERQAATLIDRGTYSGGRLETDQDITESTAIRYQTKWVQNRAEGKLPVLGAGLRYVNDLINPRDAQWLESRAFNSQQIAMLYGVPPDYLGMALAGGASSLSYSNAQDNDRRFRRNCLEAFTSQIEDALSMLTPPGRNAGESQDVRFDYSGWEASGDDRSDLRPADGDSAQ